MMDRSHGKISFECESCSEVIDTETSDFNDAREKMKNAGWHARKFGEDWVHGCPDCGVPS
jgi:hypothetical protein